MNWGVTLHRGKGEKRNSGQMRRFAGGLKSVPWAELFKINAPVYETVRITPDSSARNWRTEDITRTVADLFKLPIDRFTRDGLRVRYQVQENAAFEIEFAAGEVRFYLSAPANVMPVIVRRLQAVWPDATIENHAVQINEMVPDKTAVYELLYKRHDLYSLHTDAKDNLPLGSLLEAGKALGDGTARVFTYLEPIHQPTWHNDLTHRWEKLREGHSPKKWDTSARQLFTLAAIGISQTLKEIVTAVSDIVSNSEENQYKDKPIDPMASAYAVDQLAQATKSKTGLPGLKARIWVAVESPNADVVARTMAQAFGDLAGDNQLEARRLNKKKKLETLRVMSDKQAPKINIAYNVFSSAEAAKLVQIPGRELQEKHPEIVALNSREVQIDKVLTAGGIYLGDVTYRGQEYNIFMPTDNWDLLCLPRVVIGGMGQGKTKGYGANFIVEAVRAGFGGLIIDPAKGEAGDEVEAALPADMVKRYKIGKMLFGLDWREVMHSPRAKNRLANTIISFFNSATDEAGAQTARFIRAAVMAMQTGYLREIMQILEDAEYRAAAIEKMPEGMHRSTLQQFNRESDAMKNRILSPIYNRLDTILGDEFLAACMETDEGIDFVELLQERKAIILDVPKSELGAEGVDLIVNLISTKIDLAMTLRPDHNQFPFFVLFDEPHQFLRSAATWKPAAVESRKWRVGYVWLFHDWAQIPSDLRDIIKSALPHYHLYPSSKHTFAGLKEEIYPFTVEDGIKLKRFHAINVIRAGEDGLTKPVIARMSQPPSKRRGKNELSEVQQRESKEV